MQQIITTIMIISLGFLVSCTFPFQSTEVKGPPTVTLPLPVKKPMLFLARGTEPFWALEQTATGAKFSRPEADGIMEIWYSSVETSSGTSIIIVGTPISQGLPLRAVITPQTCSDGMSDIVYKYNAIVTLGSEVLSGCTN